MIARALLWLVTNEIRFHYPKSYRLLMHAVSAYLTLLVYWFTSQSLSGFIDQSQAWKATSYFEFLLIGELVLTLPVALVSSIIRAIRFTAAEGLTEDLSLHPRGIFAPVSLIAFSYLTREAVHSLLILLFAYVFFSFSLGLLNFIAIAGIILISLPLFYALGLISGAIFMRTGRGEGVVGQILNLGTIFAGTYFPLTILPERVAQILNFASPFTVVLQSARDVAANLPVEWWALILTLMMWNCILVAIAWWVVKGAAAAVYRRGLPPLTHP